MNISRDVVDDGIKIIENMLHDWTDREDTSMIDANEGQPATLVQQLKVYSSQIQNNIWLSSLIELL